jgi:hypothetical protein
MRAASLTVMAVNPCPKNASGIVGKSPPMLIASRAGGVSEARPRGITSDGKGVYSESDAADPVRVCGIFPRPFRYSISDRWAVRGGNPAWRNLRNHSVYLPQDRQRIVDQTAVAHLHRAAVGAGRNGDDDASHGQTRCDRCDGRERRQIGRAALRSLYDFLWAKKRSQRNFAASYPAETPGEVERWRFFVCEYFREVRIGAIGIAGDLRLRDAFPDHPSFHWMRKRVCHHGC